MIELAPHVAAEVCLAFFLIALFSVWFLDYFRGKKNAMKMADLELTTCEFCHFVYLSDVSKQMTNCPQCQCYNDKKMNKLDKKDCL